MEMMSAGISFCVFFGLLFAACSFGVAQRQFSGEYPVLLFMRSMLYCGEGLRPMSVRNVA